MVLLYIIHTDPTTVFFGLFKAHSSFIGKHPIKVVSGGLPVIVAPLIPFSDDTNGNRSKKWNKFDYWCLTLACLPVF